MLFLPNLRYSFLKNFYIYDMTKVLTTLSSGSINLLTELTHSLMFTSLLKNVIYGRTVR